MNSQYVPNQMQQLSEANLVTGSQGVYNQMEVNNESSMDSLDEVVEFIHDHAIAEGIDLDALEAPWPDPVFEDALETPWPEPVFEKDNIDVFDLADPMSTDTVTTLLQICEYCKGAFTSDHEYSSHSCHVLQKPKKPPKVVNICHEKDCKNKSPCSEHGKRFKMVLRSPRKINETKTEKPWEEMSVRARNDQGHHTCHICNKTLSRRSSLLIHMRRHTGETPYECDYCKKKFVVLYDLDRHMMTHGAKKYSCFCDICRKPFVSKSGLLQHKQIDHSNLNLYPCNICGEGFTRKSKLISHKIAHETENAMIEMIDSQKELEEAVSSKTENDMTDMLDTEPSDVQVLLLYDNHVLTT